MQFHVVGKHLREIACMGQGSSSSVVSDLAGGAVGGSWTAGSSRRSKSRPDSSVFFATKPAL